MSTNEGTSLPGNGTDGMMDGIGDDLSDAVDDLGSDISGAMDDLGDNIANSSGSAAESGSRGR